MSEWKSGRGGHREGAGRPQGAKSSDRTEQLRKRLTPTEKAQLEAYLEKLRKHSAE
jgi:hypothetical protein